MSGKSWFDPVLVNNMQNPRPPIWCTGEGKKWKENLRDGKTWIFLYSSSEARWPVWGWLSQGSWPQVYLTDPSNFCMLNQTWRGEKKCIYIFMKENTEYLELFIIVDDTKFQQGQENLIFFQIFDILYQNIIIRE